MIAKGWLELNMHTMKFCLEQAIKSGCIQMQKEFRCRMSMTAFKPEKKALC